MRSTEKVFVNFIRKCNTFDVRSQRTKSGLIRTPESVSNSLQLTESRSLLLNVNQRFLIGQLGDLLIIFRDEPPPFSGMFDNYS